MCMHVGLGVDCVFLCKNTLTPPCPPPAPDPGISTPENLRFRPIECLPMFTEVIDVGMKPKSSIFSHVSTAPPEEKAAGGRKWRCRFQATAIPRTASERNSVNSHAVRKYGFAKPFATCRGVRPMCSELVRRAVWLPDQVPALFRWPPSESVSHRLPSPSLVSEWRNPLEVAVQRRCVCLA
jgi:hypothetical protein